MHTQKKSSRPSGFTIVELLIVIVVIAILAAISIVAYTGIQNRARASEVSSALSQAKKKLELYKVDNSTYPTSGNLASAGVTSNDGSFQYTSDGSTFCLTATSGTVSYTATNTTTPGPGGCAGHGQGGVAAITNLSANPSVETNTSGWSKQEASGSASSLTRDTTQGYTGSASARYAYQTIGTNSSYPRWIAGGQATDQPVGSYTMSAWVKGPDGGHVILCPVVGSATWACGAPLNLSSSEWRQVSVGVATTAVATLSSYLRPVGASGSTLTGIPGDYWIDAVMMTSGSDMHTYADGSSLNWIWNGTANNSSSTGPAL